MHRASFFKAFQTTSKKSLHIPNNFILLPFEVCDDSGDAKYLNDETNCK